MPFVRYVDDCFVLLNRLFSHTDFLDVLNSLHPAISFTSELEQNNVLSFLDVSCFRRADGSVKTSVYRKPTFIPACTAVSSASLLVLTK